MKTRSITIPMRDGQMGAYLALPDGKPVRAIIAIMEIWGVNETMRHHTHEFADAGYVCLVPDLFGRQEADVELSDGNPDDVKKAFDLYYGFDYDTGVEDMMDVVKFLKTLPQCIGHVEAWRWLEFTRLSGEAHVLPPEMNSCALSLLFRTGWQFWTRASCWRSARAMRP